LCSECFKLEELTGNYQMCKSCDTYSRNDYNYKYKADCKNFCKDCLRKCALCENIICTNCSKICEQNKEIYCNQCRESQCHSCKKYFTNECIKICKCGGLLCEKCVCFCKDLLWKSSNTSIASNDMTKISLASKFSVSLSFIDCTRYIIGIMNHKELNYFYNGNGKPDEINIRLSADNGKNYSIISSIKKTFNNYTTNIKFDYTQDKNLKITLDKDRNLVFLNSKGQIYSIPYIPDEKYYLCINGGTCQINEYHPL